MDFDEGVKTPPANSKIIKRMTNDLIEHFKFDFIEEEIVTKKHRILIVDDDQINIMVLSRYVESYGDFEFETAFNGKQAVEIVTSNAERGLFFDIILMDCNMPVMDGFQATRLILELSKKNIISKVSIIASTANASPEDFAKCHENGMVDVLFKPYGKHVLRSKLEKYL